MTDYQAYHRTKQIEAVASVALKCMQMAGSEDLRKQALKLMEDIWKETK